VLKFCQICFKEMETDSSTCPRCGSRLGVKNASGAFVFKPTAVTKEVPSFERAALICMIPEGRVATSNAIDAFFKRHYNCDSVRYAPPTPLFAKRVNGCLVPVMIPEPGVEIKSIPNWRVVSQRGFVDLLSIDRLRKEGVEVIESGRGWRVPAYKEIGICFDRMLTEVKDAPECVI